MSSLSPNLLAFGRVLRALGLDVSPSQARNALTAVAAVGLARRRDVYHALAATLVSRAADLPVFAAAFDAFWKDPGDGRERQAPGEPHTVVSMEAEVVLPDVDDAAAPDAGRARHRRLEPTTARCYPHLERSRHAARSGLC